jgi:hypothetical protein
MAINKMHVCHLIKGVSNHIAVFIAAQYRDVEFCTIYCIVSCIIYYVQYMRSSLENFLECTVSSDTDNDIMYLYEGEM